MNAEACYARAAECAANAALASVESVSLEFLKLAAQWRAMAVRDIYLGMFDHPADAPTGSSAAPKLLSGR